MSSAPSRAFHRLLVRLDGLLSHLSRVLSTPSGVDITLLTIYYTLKLVHSQIARLQTLRLHHAVHSFTRKASAILLPGETILATIAPPQGTLAEIEASSRALTAAISDFRMFTRLWGLIGIYKWGKSTYLNPPPDDFVKAATWAQVIVNVGYQWYENVAYLASKGVLRGERFSQRKQIWWWNLSCRFWMAHVAIEAVRLMRVRQLRIRKEEALMEKGDFDASAEEKAKRVEEVAAWKRSMLVNAAYAPMTVHYSIEKGCLNEETIGLLGTVIGAIVFGRLWKSTA
ncbi:hypothetical protein H2203_008771 [Taxawa tesnikishii (nom. ined.)]|nr:hypothetical protein H2203_008771 [Dothideales sp. JES 119]